MTDSIISKEDFNILQKTLDDFILKYDRDMRGDTNADNGGRRGIVDNLRELRKTQSEFPSLTWLLSHKPTRTISALVAAHVFLSALTAVGLMRLFGAMLGVALP